MFLFRARYLCAFITVFFIEFLIAVFVKAAFIRGSLGDALVVVLIYFLIKSFLKAETKLLPLFIFIFAALVEIGQYFHLADLLGLGNIKVARIILGATFDFWDIVCYFAGCVGIWLLEP